MQGHGDESAPPAGGGGGGGQQQPPEHARWKRGGNNSSSPPTSSSSSSSVVQPWELVLVTMLVMAMIGGAAAAIVLGTRSDQLPAGTALDPTTGQVVSTYQLPTPPPPTIFRGDNAEAEEYNYLLAQVRARGSAAFTPMFHVLPPSVTDLPAAVAASPTDPLLRAAVWLTTTDTTNAQEMTLIRFVLASIYYAMGGENWTDSTHWLSPSRSYCDWKGVECCPAWPASPSCSLTDFYKVLQLDMFGNNLVGTIPPTIGLLSDVQSIFFNQNQITGTIPTALGELPKLHRLYLQHNRMTGTIPTKAVLDKGGLIDTLMLQGNGFTGNFTADWCEGYCVSCNTPGLSEFGLDCAKVNCDGPCCKYWENCFYEAQLATD